MPRFSLSLAVATFVAVFALWLATPFVLKIVVEQTLQERGQFGDLYGSINALFSGLAFAGVVIAILLQREELQLQRQELKETRSEMKRSTEAQNRAQKALNKTIYAQSFKVARDIIEDSNVVYARGDLAERQDEYQRHYRDWSETMIESAQAVARSFEAVGTMVKREILPLEYMDSWCVPVTRSWDILESYVLTLRGERDDPFIGRDFQWLADEMRQFLPKRSAQS
jgi:hypothetical protein